MKQHFKYMPLVCLFALITLLARGLYVSHPGELPSALAGKDLPVFVLSNLIPGQASLSNQTLKGQVSLLNIWASWCHACVNEHEMLMKIKNEYHVPVYGILYKDESDIALRWLDQQGNPYELIGNDNKGDVAIDFGVYGTPETYVINAQGKIIYRHVGTLTQNVWDKIIYPLIQQAG